MQAIYACNQTDSYHFSRSEHELFEGLGKLHDLYYFVLSFILEIGEMDRMQHEDLEQRNTGKKPVNTRFSDNEFLVMLRESEDLKKAIKRNKLTWQNDQDLVRKVYLKFMKGTEYNNYSEMQGPVSREKSLEIVDVLVRKFIQTSDVLKNYLEEKSIYWVSHVDFICKMVLRSFQSVGDDNLFYSMPLFKDDEDDKDFVRVLFRKTMQDDEIFMELIRNKTLNWELERMTIVDLILMKMALAEVMNFPLIPIKVSINEYIEISKEYSSPKSKVFINGVVDKVVAELLNTGKIKKVGRGLLE